MYGISMTTMHMINRMNADIERRAVYNPELRKSVVMRMKQREEKKQLEELKRRILEES